MKQSISFADASSIRHAYIIASSDEEERFSAAMRIAAAAVCRRENDLPCNVCDACRKAMSGNHPDIKVICKGEDPDAKSVLSVRQVRDVILDASVLPNESDRKVYIFRDGGDMNVQAQNASLKLLEEPPAGVILILCAEKPDIFLQTVRSRCIEIFPGEAEKAESPYLSLADEYLSLVAKRDILGLFQFCELNNTMKITEAMDFAVCVAETVTDILCGRREDPGIGREWLMEVEHLMEKTVRYLNVNVNVKQVFGMLEICSIRRRDRKETALK